MHYDNIARANDNWLEGIKTLRVERRLLCFKAM